MANDVSKLNKEDVRPIPQGAVPVIKTVMRWMTRAHVAIFRASKGRIGSTFGGSPCCMVDMIGRKSGLPRTIMLIHIPYQDGVILVASQGGMDRNPAWYGNLVANPEITVTAEGRSVKMRARLANDEEKAAAWPTAVSVYADFDEYQARTDRDIPVFLCSPVE